MIVSEIQKELSKQGKKVSRQYIHQVKDKILKPGVDYKPHPKLLIFNKKGADKIIKYILKS